MLNSKTSRHEIVARKSDTRCCCSVGPRMDSWNCGDRTALRQWHAEAAGNSISEPGKRELHREIEAKKVRSRTAEKVIQEEQEMEIRKELKLMKPGEKSYIMPDQKDQGTR